MITKSFFFMYSLETFLSYSLNLAERNSDWSKVLSFGPYAYSLMRMLMFAHQSRKSIGWESSTPVYRGV